MIPRESFHTSLSTVNNYPLDGSQVDPNFKMEAANHVPSMKWVKCLTLA